jgi:hypothetical protein
MKWLFLIIGVAAGAFAHFVYSADHRGQAFRTDLVVYRDAETGCEYLKPAWGLAGLTPRNDSLGVPICRDDGISDDVEKLLDDVGSEPAKPATPPPAPVAPTAPAP